MNPQKSVLSRIQTKKIQVISVNMTKKEHVTNIKTGNPMKYSMCEDYL